MLVHELSHTRAIDYLALFADDPWTILLDSADHKTPFAKTNRYSYLGFWPFEHLTLKADELISSKGQSTLHEPPLTTLQNKFKPFKLATRNDLPPFQGGLMGYLSYDLCHRLDHIPHPSESKIAYPELCLGVYDSIIAFDHLEKKAFFIATGIPNQTDVKRKHHAEQKWQAFVKRTEHLKKQQSSELGQILDGNLQANFTRQTYCQAVQTVKQAILNGDLFEANISQRFFGKCHPNMDKFSLYRKLRHTNPSPFSAYFNPHELTLLSSSPERFVQLTDQAVETRPIKGTCKRSSDPAEDARLKQLLSQSAKDKAENTMIVDLMRNDFSKVCTANSVYVAQLCQLESFPTVHHLVSVVKGQLKKEFDAFDLLSATYPGGSITGAPKVAAMELISAIEPNHRGPYCGSMIALGFNGNLDSSILIRTLCINGDKISFQVGGAVVLDSDPEAEFVETLDKARALFNVLESASVWS